MEKVRDAIQGIVEYLIPTKVSGSRDTSTMTSTDADLNQMVDVIGDKLRKMQDFLQQPQSEVKIYINTLIFAPYLWVMLGQKCLLTHALIATPLIDKFCDFCKKFRKNTAKTLLKPFGPIFEILYANLG